MMETSSHLSESKLLQHLLREAVNDGSSSIDEENGLDHEREVSTDNQLQSMIENYQQHVLKQKQHYQPNHYNAGPSNGHDHLKVNGGSIDGPVRVRINKTNGSTSVATPSTISHSQPCLYVTEQKYEPNGNSYLHYPHSSDPRDHHQENGPTVLSNSIDMNALRAENIFLKQQVELLQKNTKILRSLELSFERINQAFSQAVLDREKQERLEQTIRFKMEQQLQRLTNENECLQKQVEKLNLLVVQQPVDTENLLHYNRLMTDLLPQNKELLAIKERQNLEIEAQNATLEEQRNHIEMLDKALSNAQERLAAKERAAVDAAALIDKCSHQQKLLQEVMDEKKRQQEDNERQKSSMEKEVEQLRLQLEAVHSTNGQPIDAEELVRLRKNVQSKDERIEHLESNVVDIQKRFNDEKQRSEATTRTEVEALLSKIRGLEKDKADKDGRIHDLMEDKQRIHNQWANERHAFDQHMKLAALRQNDGQFNGFFSSNQSSTTSTEGQIGRPTSARAAVFHDPTLQQMEDIRQRLAERRAAPNNTANWMNRAARNGPPIHTRSASGSALSDYSSMNATISTHPPSNTAIVSLVNPIGHHSSASSVDSTTNSSDSISPSNGRTSASANPHLSTTTVNTTSNVHFSSPARSPTNRMASKMPTSTLPSYMEGLPAATRRRFAEQNSQYNNLATKMQASAKTRAAKHKSPTYTAALGTGFRRYAWNSSSNENSTQQRSPAEVATSNVSTASSDGDPHPMTTVVEVNNLHDRKPVRHSNFKENDN